MVETGSCSSGGVWRTAKWRKRTSYGRNGGPVDREGCGVPHNRGNGLVLERYGRNGGPVHREGCGVPQNGTPRDTVHLHRRPPPATTATVHPPSTSSSLHLRLFIHGLLFIQPPPRATPPATIQPALSMGPCSNTSPRATTHPALHRILINRPSTGYCSTSPLHGLLFNHPSTGYCSSSPPPSTVHPALHGVVLFIQPSTGSCSSSPNRLDRSGSCSS